jgi:hypothetical protein
MSRYDCRRCDWRPATDDDSPGPLSQLSEHAFEAEHWLCIVCGLSLERTELQTCTPCVALVRARLSEIENTYAILPGELGQTGSTPLDAPGRAIGETPLLGGDALTMLGPGSEAAHWRGRERDSLLRMRKTPWRAPQRLLHAAAAWPADPGQQAEKARQVTWVEAEQNDNRRTDTPSVAYELSRWEDDWREVRGEPVAMTEATVAGAVGYLSPLVGWAGAYHPAFDEFASDVRQLWRKLRDVIGDSDRPQVGVPCFEEGCGEDLIRQYGEEHYGCPKCRRVYDDAGYWLAVKAEMERQVKA